LTLTLTLDPNPNPWGSLQLFSRLAIAAVKRCNLRQSITFSLHFKYFLKFTRRNGRCTSILALIITVDKYKTEEIGLKIVIKINKKPNHSSSLKNNYGNVEKWLVTLCKILNYDLKLVVF
jgi:hypothetical protein